ncbi:hypothetical protein [Sulfurimonas sp.]
MCNFNNQNDETKATIHLFMQKAAQSVGGMNYLLALIEAMRAKKPNPLMQKNTQIASNDTIITWKKVVFKDKIDVIEKILVSHREAQEKDYNILSEPNIKTKKNILNMARTLTPLEFMVKPQNPNNGEGFNFGVFDTIKEDEIKFNPIFIAMFFCSTAFTKSALKHKI